MKQKVRLNIILVKGIITSVLVYLVGLVIDNYNVIAGSPSYYRALIPVYSSISILFFVYPILVIALSYLAITNYWFTSYKEWLLIRLNNSNTLLKRQFIKLIENSIVFTFLIWILGTGVLVCLDKITNFTNLPVHQGIIAVFGNKLGLILCLILTILYNVDLMLLPMILNYLVNKKWQVLFGAILIELFLPILLFNLDIIPEKYLTFAVLNNVILANNNELDKVLISFLLVIIVLILELVIIFGINLIKRRRKF